MSRRNFGDAPRYIPPFVANFREKVTIYLDLSKASSSDITNLELFATHFRLSATNPGKCATFRVSNKNRSRGIRPSSPRRSNPSNLEMRASRPLAIRRQNFDQIADRPRAGRREDPGEGSTACRGRNTAGRGPASQQKQAKRWWERFESRNWTDGAMTAVQTPEKRPGAAKRSKPRLPPGLAAGCSE